MSAVRGALLKAASELITRGVGLITLPILMRFAGVGGYGAYIQVGAILGLVTPFASLGLSAAMVRYFSTDPWSGSLRDSFVGVLRTMLGVSAIIVLVLVAAAPFLNAHLINWPGGEVLIRCAVVLVLTACVEQLLLGFFRAREWYVQLSTVEILLALSTVAAIATVLPLGLNLKYVFVAVSATRGAVLIVSYGSLWWWNRPREIRSTVSVPELEKMVRFGLPTVIAGFGLTLTFVGSRLVLGHYMNTGAVGHFGALFGVAVLSGAVIAPVNLSFYPRLIIAFSSGDPSSVEATMGTYQRYASLALVPAIFFLVLATGPLLQVVTGHSFDADLLTTAMLVLAVGLDQYNSSPQYILYCKNETKFKQYCWLGGGVMNVLLSLLLVPPFGLRGAAGATLVSFLSVELAFSFRAGKFVRIPSMYALGTSLKALCAAALAGAATGLAFEGIVPSIARILMAAVLFSATYALVLALLGEVRKADVQILRRALFVGG